MFENSNYPFYDIPATPGDTFSQLIGGLRVLIRGYVGPLIRLSNLPYGSSGRVTQDIYSNSTGYVDNAIALAFGRAFGGYAFIDRIYNQSANAGNQGYMYVQQAGGAVEGLGNVCGHIYVSNGQLAYLGGKSYICRMGNPYPGGASTWMVWNQTASSSQLEHTFSGVFGPQPTADGLGNSLGYNPSPFDDKPSDPQHISCYLNVSNVPRWDVGSTPISVLDPLPPPDPTSLDRVTIKTVQDIKNTPVNQRTLSVYNNGVLTGQSSQGQSGLNLSAHAFGPVVMGSLNYGAQGINSYAYSEFAYWHGNPNWIGQVMAAQRTATGL